MDLGQALLGLAVFYFLVFFGGGLLENDALLLMALGIGVYYWITNQ
ncbi:MAG: hypothetical protein QXR53_01555 [Candidatus Norongarragalinales archaeon]